MPKTDKELTAEIVCAIVNAGGTKDKPLLYTVVPTIIAPIYEALRSLPEKDED